MSDFSHHDFKKPTNYELQGREMRDSSWGGYIFAAAAVAVVLALIVAFGSGGTGTTELHPGEAGAPAVAVPTPSGTDDPVTPSMER